MPEWGKIEPQCEKLVAALNLLPGVSTTASCGCCSRYDSSTGFISQTGDIADDYYVAFVIERPADLLPLVSLLRRPSLQGWIVQPVAYSTGRVNNPPYELRFILSYDGEDANAAHRASEKLATQIRRIMRTSA